MLVFAAPMLLAITAGIGVGVVFKRWGPGGLWFLGIAAVVLTGLAVTLVTWQDSWAAVGSFFLDSPLAVLVLLLPAVTALALAGLGFAGLRRAVP